MENNESNESLDEQSMAEDVEISHSDKMVGVLTEPTKTFENISKFPLKTMDWLLPLFLLLLVVAISRIVVLNNNEIKNELKEKQIAKIEQSFTKAVEEGKMTQQQADEQMDKIRDRFDNFGGGLTIVIQTVSIFIVGFIFFFIMSGIYYLFIKFGLKGEGTFVSVLVASGMTAYIGIISIIVATILSMAFSRMFNDVSVASFMGIDKSTTMGFILGKFDIFSIWVYAVLSIGFAKLFKSASTSKYYALVFGLWIIGTYILYLLGKVYPFLNFS